jgi:hypothetical protein
LLKGQFSGVTDTCEFRSVCSGGGIKVTIVHLSERCQLPRFGDMPGQDQ